MLIVFDLDGTLSDSRRAIVDTFLDACSAMGCEPPEPGQVVSRIGLPLDRMFRELTEGDAQALSAAYRERYLHHDALTTRLFDGVEGLLQELSHHTLAVATSKSTEGAERTVRRAGIRHHFAHVLGHDSVARPKPHADMLVEVMRRSGHPPDETRMVGDTVFDLQMADAAGVRGIAVSWGAHSPERLGPWPLVHTVPELAARLLG